MKKAFSITDIRLVLNVFEQENQWVARLTIENTSAETVYLDEDKTGANVLRADLFEIRDAAGNKVPFAGFTTPNRQVFWNAASAIGFGVASNRWSYKSIVALGSGESKTYLTNLSKNYKKTDSDWAEVRYAGDALYRAPDTGHATVTEKGIEVKPLRLETDFYSFSKQRIDVKLALNRDKERVTATLTFHNLSAEPVKLRRDRIFLSEKQFYSVFNVQDENGSPVLPHSVTVQENQSAKKADDLAVLQAGEQLEAEVDLSKFYSLPANKPFSVTYSADVWAVPDEKKTDSFTFRLLSSERQAIHVESLQVSLRVNVTEKSVAVAEVTFSNPTDQSAWLYIPHISSGDLGGDVFAIQSVTDGVAANAIYKGNVSPEEITEHDFLELPSHESVSTEITLSDYYQILENTDLSVRYKAPLVVWGLGGNLDKQHLQAVQSNATRFSIVINEPLTVQADVAVVNGQALVTYLFINHTQNTLWIDRNQLPGRPMNTDVFRCRRDYGGFSSAFHSNDSLLSYRGDAFVYQHEDYLKLGTGQSFKATVNVSELYHISPGIYYQAFYRPSQAFYSRLDPTQNHPGQRWLPLSSPHGDTLWTRFSIPIPNQKVAAQLLKSEGYEAWIDNGHLTLVVTNATKQPMWIDRAHIGSKYYDNLTITDPDGNRLPYARTLYPEMNKRLANNRYIKLLEEESQVFRLNPWLYYDMKRNVPYRIRFSGRLVARDSNAPMEVLETNEIEYVWSEDYEGASWGFD